MGQDDSSKDAKEVRRRFFEKERQKQMRIRKKASFASLLQEVTTLETALRSASAGPKPITGFLAWRDVAQALGDARTTSCETNRDLKSRMMAIKQLTSDLQTWVASCCSVPTQLDPACPTWRDVTLLGSSMSRQMGKEWITKRMYHQMDHLFHVHGMCADEGRDFLEASASDTPGVHFITRGQMVVGLPMHLFLDLYRRHPIEISCFDLTAADLQSGHLPEHNTVVEETKSTTLHQAIRHHPMQLDEVAHMLVGVFEESAERAIVVVTNILQDEAMSSTTASMANRPLQIWYEFQAKTATTTQMRLLAVCGSISRNKQPISLEEEAIVSGVDVEAVRREAANETIVEAKLKTHMQMAFRSSLSIMRFRQTKMVMKFLQDQASRRPLRGKGNREKEPSTTMDNATQKLGQQTMP
ncbi:Aste57867_1175 [Aphanomyces stellatus]|uniref:Aste57867_1175 protein n=1 Tax=Aphanomyces stellatus TaxID=120398 RepID=A0A485K9N1_9STRA|nr:hypothetical protein As57867_001174 [Aphanomyces stellatus]VFT78395.1 Aste57867_1175 [Aphanomyces stellatus]